MSEHPTPIEVAVVAITEEITTKTDQPRVCPSCHGRGDFATCETCHGLGLVSAEQVAEKVP